MPQLGSVSGLRPGEGESSGPAALADVQLQVGQHLHPANSRVETWAASSLIIDPDPEIRRADYIVSLSSVPMISDFGD